MKRDWFAPVILVPAGIMAAACMIWVLLAGSGVGDARGGLCGRALAASILAVVLIRRRERRSTDLAREEAALQGEGAVGRWLTDDGSA